MTNDGPANPYQQPADTIRSAAKWLVTAFAGVGGILVAGIPLTKLGDLRPWRSYVAGALILIALAAISFIIVLVARVFSGKYVTLADFGFAGHPERTGWLSRIWVKRQMAPIRAAVNRSREELYGAEASSLAELNTKLTEVTERLRAQTGKAGAGARQDDIDERARLMAAAERVVAFANYEEVRSMFARTAVPLGAAAFIVAASVSFFAYVVGSAPPLPVRVTSPTPVHLSLHPQGNDYWAKLFGKTCDIAKVVDAVAIAGDFSTPEVVTAGDGDCKSASFELTADRGTAVPVVAPAPPKSATP